jgi:DNA helicase-2/ATP-dependent DNA helicase PcrA
MPRREDSAGGLNPQQEAAVGHNEGPLLVVAGAGTGKTLVITERIKRLLESDPDLPSAAILGLTFTDKAAAEMKHRVVKTLGPRGRDVWLGTFHDFCLNRVLREVTPGVMVLDDEDHWIVLRRNLPLLRLDIFRRVAEPGQFLRDFCQFFSRCQDELVSPDDYDEYVRGLERAYERGRSEWDATQRAEQEQALAQERELARVYRISDQLLREKSFCTFGMMLQDTVAHLRRNHALRERLQSDYRYILVDEFQDTNIAQIALLELLCGTHGNVMGVGDNNQAIYRFRGASFSSFTLFLERFTGARPAPGSLGKHFLPLTQNYRSTQRILRCAGQVIAQNEASPYLPEKKLFTENPAGDRIQVVEVGSNEDEAAWVAGQIAALHAKGHPWREFAVLYRMHLHKDQLVGELARRDIPFVIRNLTILSHPLVRDLIAYLRLIAAPSDDVACARVLAMPAWGLDALDLARLCERTSRSRGVTLWNAVENARSELPFAERRPRLADLVELIQRLHRRAFALMASELFDELAADLGLRFAPDDPARPYLERFAQFIREWEVKSITDSTALRDFVEYLRMFEEAGGQIALPESWAPDAVQLMTVHAAKGLEFEHVFILRLSSGGFPPRARPAVLEFPAALVKEEQPQGDFRVQEERRLFYVAMTRARKRLALLTVVNKRQKPSLFLDDLLREPAIQRSDVQRLAPKVTHPAPPEPPRAEQLAFTQMFSGDGDTARTGSRIGAWAGTFRPPAQVPLLLSATAIDTYTTCALRYLFQRGWGIRGEAHAAMTFGNVMHAAVRFVVKAVQETGGVAWEEVERAFEREWRSAGFEDDYQEQEYRKEGLTQLRAFYEEYAAAPPQVIGTERNFDLAFDAETQIRGRMDQINRREGGQLEVVDYKTGRPRDERNAKKSLQLSIYALAAQDLFEATPARLTFYNLTTNSAVSTTRSEKQLERARDEISDVADNIRAGNFAAAPGFHCKFCDYRPLCPAHETSAAIVPARKQP